MIFCFDLFLKTASQSLYLSDELITASGFIVNSALALSMMWLLAGRLWRPAAPAGGSAAEPSAPTGERRGILWPLARFLANIVAIAVPVSAFLGYRQLAQFFAVNLVLSAALLGLAWSVHGAVRDVVGLLTDERYGSGLQIRRALRFDEQTARLIKFWSVLLLEIALLAASIFLMLLIWGADWANLLVLVERIWSGISIGKYTVAVGDILIGIAAFVFLVVLVRAGQRLFDERLKSQTRIDVGVRHALRAGFGYTGIVIAAMLAISVAGFDLSNLALIAGALSVGIGFGLQAIVNNFVSGIILLVERPIKEGDWVIVDGHEGHVRNISVRSTEISTFQRASVIIPNATLITSPVVNWSHKDPSGRIDVAVGVAYESDVEKVQDILLACAEQHDKVWSYPAPEVLFRDFGDSALAFELRCFTGDIGERLPISSDLRFAIDGAFRANGIEIPFPQRDIHVREAKPPKGRAKSNDPAPSKPKTRSARRRRAESGEAGNGGADA